MDILYMQDIRNMAYKKSCAKVANKYKLGGFYGKS